jgi:hypothetical protein
MMVDDTIALLEHFQSSKTIVWRTSGLAFEDSFNATLSMNEKVMDLIDSFSLARQQQSFTNAVRILTFIDWDGALLTRSFGDDRIEGDFVPHDGVETRHAAQQMITSRSLECKSVLHSIDKATRPIQNTFVAQSTSIHERISIFAALLLSFLALQQKLELSVSHSQMIQSSHWERVCTGRVDGITTICPPRVMEAQPHTERLLHVLTPWMFS